MKCDELWTLSSHAWLINQWCEGSMTEEITLLSVRSQLLEAISSYLRQRPLNIQLTFLKFWRFVCFSNLLEQTLNYDCFVQIFFFSEFNQRRLYHLEWRTIFGQWVKLDHVDPALRYTLTDQGVAMNSLHNLSILAALISSNCGILSLCNLTSNYETFASKLECKYNWTYKMASIFI